MRRFVSLLLPALIVTLAWPLAASAITEPKTNVEYPDVVTTGCNGQQVEMKATGTGLREKTIMKVDVYTIVSYVRDGVDLGGDTAAGLIALDEPPSACRWTCAAASPARS